MKKNKKQAKTDNTFDWKKTKEYLATLPDTTEKIKHLIIKKAEYLQQLTGMEWDLGTPYDKQCELEINKLATLIKLEPRTSIPIKAKGQYKLSDKTGAKTDLIRILNAVHGLKLLHDSKGNFPSKEQFMKDVGEFFGVDLSKYDVNLSQTFNGTLEANLKVFEAMQKIYTDDWTKRNK